MLALAVVPATAMVSLIYIYVYISIFTYTHIQVGCAVAGGCAGNGHGVPARAALAALRRLRAPGMSYTRHSRRVIAGTLGVLYHFGVFVLQACHVLSQAL